MASGFGVGQPSYSTSLRMFEVSVAAPNAQNPPNEWPSRSTAEPEVSATASTTAATSSNSRTASYSAAWAAATSAAAVHGVHREVRLQVLQPRRPASVVGRRAVHQH